MPSCPRCHQSISSQALSCPHCRIQLKAHGHPGIPLFRATGDEPLCATCLYHEDDSCNYPQRPYAQECTLYTDRTQPVQVSFPPRGAGFDKFWFKRNLTWLALLGLVVISVLIALLR